MNDYKKINASHHLSAYQVKVPYWNSTKAIRTPFLNWSKGGALSWYQDYNSLKHDRYVEFSKASFENLLDACCGLLILLSAQFARYDFVPEPTFLTMAGGNDVGMAFGIGGYFQVKFPDDLLDEEFYDFDWEVIKQEPDPFQSFDYRTIK